MACRVFFFFFLSSVWFCFMNGWMSAGGSLCTTTTLEYGMQSNQPNLVWTINCLIAQWMGGCCCGGNAKVKGWQRVLFYIKWEAATRRGCIIWPEKKTLVIYVEFVASGSAKTTLVALAGRQRPSPATHGIPRGRRVQDKSWWWPTCWKWKQIIDRSLFFGRPLPPSLPLVIHHGERKWNEKTHTCTYIRYTPLALIWVDRKHR